MGKLLEVKGLVTQFKVDKNKIINDVNKDYFLYMTKNYGRLKVISLLCKTILDKNL